MLRGLFGPPLVSNRVKDLIESNHLSDEMKYLALDKKKVLRAKTHVIQEAVEIGEIQAHNDIITGVYFDGRKDNTLVQIYDEKLAVTGRESSKRST